MDRVGRSLEVEALPLPVRREVALQRDERPRLVDGRLDLLGTARHQGRRTEHHGAPHGSTGRFMARAACARAATREAGLSSSASALTAA